MAMKPDSPLQVGDWHYLPEQDKLVQFDAAGKIVLTADLDNLSQKVVNYFIVHAGKLVTKDELLLDVWGIRDVSDGRVTRVIRVLRVALGDDTREPSYIETIPKRGYRFIAPIKVLAPADDNEQDDFTDDEPTAIRRKNNYLLWLTIGLLLIASASLSWVFWPENTSNETAQTIPLLRYQPVTSLDGLEFYHNVSEDERYLLYSYASPDNENVTVLMLEDLQEHRRHQLTESSYSSFGAAFSPDGKQIAYHRYYPDGRCSIRLVQFDNVNFSTENDTELTPCTDKSPSSRLAWSPDSKYVIYSTIGANKQIVLLMKPVQGGAADQLTTPPPSSFGDYAARFSFRGDKIVFIRGTGNHAQLWLLNLANRELTLLVNAIGTLPGNVGWSADDMYVIYPSSPTVISRVEIATGVSSVVAYTDFGTGEVQTLQNGRLYATVGNFAHTNIKEISNALISSENLNQVVFSSNRNESYAAANPIEGGPTAVVSRRSGLPQVWLFSENGVQRQLTFFEKNERIRSLDFAPNGKDIILQLQNELWLLSDTGELTRVPHSDNQTVTAPAWGSTGEYVYYAESINGRWQIARYNVATKKIDAEPYAFDRELYLESYDGKYSFWRDAVSKKFYVKFQDSDILQEVPISFPDNQLWLKFQIKSSGLYFTYLLDDIYYRLKFYDVQSNKIVDVVENQTLTHSQFSVSADEKRIFVLESVRGDFDIAALTLP